MNQHIPSWITYYLWFVTIFSAVFAVIIYIDPAIMWSHWEAADAVGAFSLAGPTGLFCARNLGIAAMGAFALLNRSVPMIEGFLVFRVVTDGLDGLHALIGDNPPVIFIGFGTATFHAFLFAQIRMKKQT